MRDPARLAEKPWHQAEPFVHLPSAVRDELAQAADIRRVPKGTLLFREGESADHLWILQEGWVQLVRHVTADRFLTLDLATPKDGVFGLSAFGAPAYVSSAVSATSIVAVQLPAKIVRKLLVEHAAFAASAVKIFSHRLNHVAAAYATAFAPVEIRIASVLLRLEEDFGHTLPVTRKQVAELAGTTVETAIRVTNRMRRDRLLLMRRGQIALVSPHGLAQKLKAA